MAGIVSLPRRASRKQTGSARYWARWSDAVREAGLQPNTLQGAYGEEFLLEKLASLAKELGRFPGRTEIHLKGHSDKSFPDAKTFQRLGSKAEVAAKLARFCAGREGYHRSDRYYKIGRSNAVGRRERELAIQLPERAVVVHSIKTDDPAGIESYWHRRFENRRKNGEWFELTAQDVSAFKRRKFM